MAVAVVVPGWSLLGMALVTFWLAGERLERSEPTTWRLRVPTKAMRLVLAQTEIALRGRAPSRRGAEEEPYPAATLARERRT